MKFIFKINWTGKQWLWFEYSLWDSSDRFHLVCLFTVLETSSSCAYKYQFCDVRNLLLVIEVMSCKTTWFNSISIGICFWYIDSWSLNGFKLPLRCNFRKFNTKTDLNYSFLALQVFEYTKNYLGIYILVFFASKVRPIDRIFRREKYRYRK